MAAVVLATALSGKHAWAHQYKNLANFSSAAGSSGMTPVAILYDGAGNLFGVTHQGGSAESQGTIFKLTPPASGTGLWMRSVLSVFHGADGAYPNSALVRDATGRMYGITQLGGSYGNGTVFMMVPPDAAHAAWRRVVIYNFQGGTDGATPVGLAMGPDRALYGTTSAGGNAGLSSSDPGTVFKLMPNGNKTVWTESVLHRFSSAGTDGYQPHAGVTFGPHGVIFGTTYYGGTHAAGTVYRLSPNALADTGYDETVLYNFAGTFSGPGDAAYPGTALTRTSDGALYGTTYYGGSKGLGTVFKLTVTAAGAAERVIYNFQGAPNGAHPVTPLLLDAFGALRGATYAGGPAGYGIVYKLTAPASGPAAEDITVNLGTGGNPSALPTGYLVLRPDGTVYGTTSSSVAAGTGGTVYQVR